MVLNHVKSTVSKCFHDTQQPIGMYTLKFSSASVQKSQKVWHSRHQDKILCKMRGLTFLPSVTISTYLAGSEIYSHHTTSK